MSVYSAPFSNNNKKFSLCSQYEHETVMRSRENVTNCFLKNDDALKAKLLTALTNYTAPFGASAGVVGRDTRMLT